MSSRPVSLLWVSVNVGSAHEEEHANGKKKRIRFFFPVPVFLLLMLVDIAEDFTEWISLFPASRRLTLKWPLLVKTAVQTGKAVVFELMFHTGPTDLVDVDVAGKDDGKDRVRVKILLR